MATESGGSSKPVAVIIVGADALLAARPATPIQLWHACLAAGYDLAVPATWGDELIATECLRAVAAHPETVAVMCSCPMVARALADGEADLTPHIVSLVAPPVAAARYLRRVYGDRRVHVTFVGACPAAGDSAIDAWIAPAELLERFATNQIELTRQPQLFESILPPDRRRHASQPGGMPTAERAAVLPRPRQIIDIDADDVVTAIRRHLMGGVRTLVDAAPRLGCTCSGAAPGLSASEARLAVTMLEPPRSARPVMADPGGLALLRRTPPRPTTGTEIRKPADPATPSRGSLDEVPRERAVATSRPATRSPLSWNLRERALPSQPTIVRHSEPVPIHGASSGEPSAPQPVPAGDVPDASGHAVAPPVDGGAEGSVDAATAAAVHALEVAAAKVGGAKGAGSPSSWEQGATASGARESGGQPRDNNESLHQTSRATPPGGYWFVPTPVAGAPDSEVERNRPTVEDRASPSDNSGASDAGDTRASSPSDNAGAPDDGEPRAVESAGVASESAPPEPGAVAAPPEIAEPEVLSAELATQPSAPAPGSAEPTTQAEPSMGARESASAEPERVDSTASSSPEARPNDGNDDFPGRPWVVAMTIILLLAGAMVARNIAQRRPGEAAMAARDVSRRTERVAGGALGLGTPGVALHDVRAGAASGDGDPGPRAHYRAARADIVSVASGEQRWRRSTSVNALFVGPAPPGGREGATPAVAGNR
jgi:hypothetical protein